MPNFRFGGRFDAARRFWLQEQNVYIELYKNNYYAQKVMENLGAGSLGFTTIREGDTTLTKVSPTEIAKTYQTLKNNSDRKS